MADETYDPRLESLLRSALAAEAASLPLTVRPGQILERADRLGRSGGSRRRRSIFGWPTVGLRQPAFALGGIAALAVVGALAFATLRPDLAPPAGGLPTTPDAWTRIVLPSPAGSRLHALAAGPRGLLAVVFEQDGDGPTRLMVSTDGHDWRTVSDDRNPTPWKASLFGGPSVTATEDGFLLMMADTIWTSETGDDWRQLDTSASDPDLSQRWMRAAAKGGPGLVAVGSDPTAWYSVDGSDWTTAQVPDLPAAIVARPDPERAADMTGLAVAGDRLVAWGSASVANGDEPLEMPLLWASDDGHTWTDVADPRMGTLVGVAGGPHGFVAVDQGPKGDVLWSSTDGHLWTPVDGFDAGKLTLASVAAGSFGYVVAATDAASGKVAMWTSADVRSWSRVPGDDRFAGGSSGSAIAWGSHFVVGGIAGDRPVIWISGSGRNEGGPTTSPAP